MLNRCLNVCLVRCVPRTQHFAHNIDGLALAFMVGSNNHFTEQSHCDELHADHHEQNGQNQQRTPPDVIPKDEFHQC